MMLRYPRELGPETAYAFIRDTPLPFAYTPGTPAPTLEPLHPRVPVCADLILTNGRILTLTGRRDSGLAILGDRIIGLGEDDALRPLRGPRTRVIDLQGRLAPGYLADIVVLSEDVTRLRGRRMLKTELDSVFVGVRLRYRRRSA